MKDLEGMVHTESSTLTRLQALISECISYSRPLMQIRQMTLILIHPQLPTALYSILGIEIDQLRPKAAIHLIHQMCPVRKSLLVSLWGPLKSLLCFPVTARESLPAACRVQWLGWEALLDVEHSLPTLCLNSYQLLGNQMWFCKKYIVEYLSQKQLNQK